MKFNIYCLWYMDTAKWAKHPRSLQWRVSDAATCALVLCLRFFFFFWIRADSDRIHTDSALIHADSARIGSYWLNWIISISGQNRSKSALLIMPEQPKFSLNKAQIKHPKFYFEYLLLLLCFVFLSFFFLCFVNQGNIMCFLRIF